MWLKLVSRYQDSTKYTLQNTCKSYRENSKKLKMFFNFCRWLVQWISMMWFCFISNILSKKFRKTYLFYPTEHNLKSFLASFYKLLKIISFGRNGLTIREIIMVKKNCGLKMNSILGKNSNKI